MLRYSLGSLFVATLFVGLGCLAITEASLLVRRITLTSTVALLMIAVLGAFFLKGKSQVFAAGVALTGWTYFLMIFGSFVDVRDQALTDNAVSFLYMAMHRDLSDAALIEKEWLTEDRTVSPWVAPPSDGIILPPALDGSIDQLNMYGVQWSVHYGDVFRDIGHCLWTILLASFGGVVAVFFRGCAKRAERSAGD